jgi:Zn-dependent M28 family amino/carboxypeptidase
MEGAVVLIVVSLISGIVAAGIGLLRWFVIHPRQPFLAAVPPLSDDDRACALRLESHVRAVASTPHNMAHPKELEAAATYIEHVLVVAGYIPKLQPYEVAGQTVRNIEVVIEPSSSSIDAPTYVIGAHYDAPDNCPGANDNGTGVAALLDLAARLTSYQPTTHRIRLVFFVNEEHPYGHTPDMGSYRHAQALQAIGERVVGMFALETLGHFSDVDGSQRFPFPFNKLLPTRGNFVAFIGMPRGRALARLALDAFRATTQFPAIGGVAPAFIEGIANSDHWSYDKFGYPAIMVTDTAPFRNPFYHQVFDTPDTVDYASLSRITAGLERTIKRLAP